MPRPHEWQLTMQDVAKASGLKYESIQRYRIRGRFPEPDGMIGVTPWWRWETIDVWLRTRNTKRGGPRKRKAKDETR